MTLGEDAPISSGFPKLTLVLVSWLLLIPIDVPLSMPGDLLGLCVCCLAITGLEGVIKLYVGLVDAGIFELLIEVS